jgi:Ca2+-binding RTX toxin-like protein
VPGQAYPITWSAAGDAIALRGGAQLTPASGTVTRAFAHWDVLAVNGDWSRAAVSVSAGRYFAYEGNDLYVAEPLGSGARLVSPRRCSAFTRCREGDDMRNILRATQPNSWVRGLAGHDVLIGSSGFDRIEGAFGDDGIDGNAGNDHLFGDVGRDRIRGGEGDDFIDGGPGDDVLTSGSGRGRIFAGPGNDHIDTRLGRRTAVHCGEGIDTVQASRSTRIAQDCERVQTR